MLTHTRLLARRLGTLRRASLGNGLLHHCQPLFAARSRAPRGISGQPQPAPQPPRPSPPPPPSRRLPSRLLGFFYRGAAVLGGSVALLGVGVVGLFLYDASTYSESSTRGDMEVPQLALQPRRGGPKNLPIAEVFIDDCDGEQTKDSSEKKRRIGDDKPRLVILGGGWGGVALLKELNPDDYHVTVISPKNYFLFTPMLPSATVGTLELRSLVEPIRRVVRRVGGHYIRAQAEDIEFEHRLVEVTQPDADGGGDVRFYVPYDKLVVAVGSVSNPHGVHGLENAHFLKDVDDARRIRNRVMRNLELACLPTTSDEERRRLLSFVVCGGGPTGVEFAAELYDLLSEDLTRHFPRLLRNEIAVHLIQSQGHILNTYDARVSRYAEDRFAHDQVTVLTNSRVCEVAPDRIVFTQPENEDGSGAVITKELPMGFCLWSTGVAQTDLARKLAARLGSPSQTNRRALETDTHLRLQGAPAGEVYAIGDCATVQNNLADNVVAFLEALARKRGVPDPRSLRLRFNDWKEVAADVRRRFPQAAAHLRHLDRLFLEFDKDRSGTLDLNELCALLREIDSKLTSLPATAQRAHQQGIYLARKLRRLGRAAADGIEADQVRDGDLDAAVSNAFEYHHLGNLAYIGNSAVFDLGEGWSVAGGIWAVYAWRFVYFSQSVSTRTRILMAMDWTKRCLFGRDMISF